MLTLRSFLPSAALAAVLVASGCSGPRVAPVAFGADGTPIVATWFADTLTLAEFDEAYTAADGAIVDTTTSPLDRRLDFLDRYVDFKLKVLSARDAGYDRDSSYQVEVEAYRDQLAGPYFLDRRVIDGIVRDMYEKQAEELRVSHILFFLSPAASPADSAATYDRALSLRDSIASGIVSFEEAAARFSDDPSAQRNNGDLNYLTGGRTVLDFENAAYETPVGELSGPVRTQFGVHLVKVTDRRPRRSEIQARHILIRAQSDAEVDSATAVIDSLRARVLAGDDFAELAREFSDDTGSGARGGDLGTFGRGRMVPPFEQAAFELDEVDDLSGPVVSRFGVHLIQLTGVSERPSYEESYTELRQLAERLPRTALRRQELGREFIDAVGGTYDAPLVREAVMQYGEDAARDSVLALGFGDYAERTFATVGDSTYAFDDVIPTLRRTRYGPHPAGEMIEATRGFVEEQAVQQALARLEERDPEFARVFQSYAEGVRLFRVAEDSVWTPAKEDEAGLRAYFEARPGQFRFPERRRVLAFRS
ncbi:MAG: peptidylprolyl isomerase, partial [Bacteroidota bacterium]